MEGRIEKLDIYSTKLVICFVILLPIVAPFPSRTLFLLLSCLNTKLKAAHSELVWPLLIN